VIEFDELFEKTTIKFKETLFKFKEFINFISEDFINLNILETKGTEIQNMKN
jgi:hypothetical protein